MLNSLFEGLLTSSKMDLPVHVESRSFRSESERGGNEYQRMLTIYAAIMKNATIVTAAGKLHHMERTRFRKHTLDLVHQPAPLVISGSWKRKDWRLLSEILFKY
jgi:hypothetical protein